MAMPSCINHPEQEMLLILREWQIDYCEGNHIAAALLSILEYWHNIKYRKQQQKPIEQRSDNDLLQFHTEKELISKMLTVTRTPANLRKAIKYLEQKNAISVHRNPNKRYYFDRTRHFLLHPEVINKWLETYTGDTNKITDITKLPKKRNRKQGGDREPRPEVRKAENPALLPVKKQIEKVTQISEKPTEKQGKPSDSLIKEALLQELPEQEKSKADNILKTLQDKNLYQAIIEEWLQALNQGKVKNKFSYLAGLVNRANQGKFHPTVSKTEQHAQKIAKVISVPATKPQAQQPHEIFPAYKNWQAVQQKISEKIKKMEYMNFVLPTRAYESDKAIFLRCPNVYAFDFMKNNQQQLAEIVGREIKIYMG
jgi:hypothetical protein